MKKNQTLKSQSYCHRKYEESMSNDPVKTTIIPAKPF